MIAPLKPGVTLAQPDGPVIQTERLILRRWCGADVAPNTAMLADPGTARFITADGKPVTSDLVGWRNAAILSGHWVLHGFGMFVVEEKSSGRFAGRVGPWFPPGWPGFEVGWVSRTGFAARVMRLRRRGRRSTGRSRPSSSTGSSTVSIAKTRRRRPWRGGLEPKNTASSICSAISPTSG